MILPVVSYPENNYYADMKNLSGLSLGHGWNKGIRGDASHVKGNDWGFQKTDSQSLYKTDRLAYVRQHKRWYRLSGKAKICELCDTTNNVQWHNKSGEYLLIKSDWMQVCAKCHFKIDNRKAGK